MLLLLQILPLYVERKVSSQELALNLVQLAQLLQELLLLKLIDHVSLVIQLLEASAKAFIDLGLLRFDVDLLKTEGVVVSIVSLRMLDEITGRLQKCWQQGGLSIWF